jgi:flagellin-like hook-associated protein FlgL
MRVTQSLLLRGQAAALTAAYGRIFEVQASISSGRRLLRPSDDPTAIRPALGVRAARGRLEQVRRNAEFAGSELATAEGALQNASDLIARAREIAVSGANGTLTQAERDGMAIEVQGLLDQLLTLANSRGATGYLFAGGAKAQAAFEKLESGGTAIVYRGDGASTAVDLGDSLDVALDVPGTQVFTAGMRGLAVYSGATGAAAGGGSDRLLGTARLTVAHARTVLGDGALAGTGDSVSGLRVGSSSAALDTVLGPAGAWSIQLVDASGTGSAGTVSLDGGPAVAWTAGDTDLEVTAPGGEVVHLDLSGIVAGFNGTVTLAGEGTLSLDGGLTSSAIDFTNANQIAVDSRTGATLYVDARSIARSGVEVVRQSGSYDLFAALVELRDALRNSDGDSSDVQVIRIRDALAELAAGQDRLLGALATLGARMRLVESTSARAQEVDAILAGDQAGFEDADLAAASVELSAAELALQAGLAVSARIAQLPTLIQLL